MATNSSVSSKCPVVLKTADQYDIWKARVADACWSATAKDVFSISDEECKKAIALLEAEDQKAELRATADWVGKCWTIITKSMTFI